MNQRRFRTDLVLIVVGEALLLVFLVCLFFFSPLNFLEWLYAILGALFLVAGLLMRRTAVRK